MGGVLLEGLKTVFLMTQGYAAAVSVALTSLDLAVESASDDGTASGGGEG